MLHRGAKAEILMQDKKEIFITCQELAECLQAKKQPFIFDCSWNMPKNGEKGLTYNNWKQKRIPSSEFLDIDLNWRNEEFQHFLTKTGLKNVDEPVVLYDSIGIWSVAKAYWILMLYGFKNVRILSGGFAEWEKLGLPIEEGEQTTQKSSIEQIIPKELNPFPMVNAEFLSEYKDIHSGQIVDLRPSNRFIGGEAGSEPRPGIPSGHIPGSLNIPYSTLRTEDGKFMLSHSDLEQVFAKNLGQNWKEKNLIFSCGSGVTACIGFLAAKALGKSTNTSVYAGSWKDYCQRIQNKE